METVQRIEAYRFILKQFESNDPPTHICSELRTYHYEHTDNIGFNIFNYPELLAQKPKDRGVSIVLAWWPFEDIASRITAIKAAITLAENTLYHETVKTAVNELGLEMLPIPINDTAKVLLHMITCNGVTCKDSVKSGYRARIANIMLDHGLAAYIGKEVLHDVNEFKHDYRYMRHYVKPEHVSEVILAYLRINCPNSVKARKLKVLEAVQDCGV